MVTTKFVVSKDGTRVAYDESGEGPPLILVVGALGGRSTPFTDSYRKELAKQFTIIMYDRRGRGESSDTQPYAVQREVEDLAALVDACSGPPYVAGISSGAALALEAAASGVPMAGLFAYEPPYMVGDPPDAPPADFREHLTALISRGDRDGAVRYFMRTVGMSRVMLAIMRLFPMWKSLRAVAHTLPYDAAVMKGFALPEDRLKKVHVPTVVAAGSKTTPTLLAAAEAVARVVPGAKHKVLARQTHGVKPAALARALAEEFRPEGK